MKKIGVFILLIVFVLSGLTVSASKKKAFTGKVTYTIGFDNKNMPDEVKAMLPKTMSFYVGEGKVKTEIYTQMGMQSSVEDLNAKTKIALLEIMGQKFTLYETMEEVMKEREDIPELEIEITEETKEIAGYTCKKVVARNKQDSSVYSSAWFTDALEVPQDINLFNEVFSNVQGLLLEFDMETAGDMKMTFTAVEVESRKIKDNVFEIPADFKKTTREELMDTFGG